MDLCHCAAVLLLPGWEVMWRKEQDCRDMGLLSEGMKVSLDQKRPLAWNGGDPGKEDEVSPFLEGPGH